MSSAGKKTDSSEARRDVKESRRKPKTSSDYLSSIDKLLGAAFDLMKQTTAVDRAAFEQLRQLRVKIRYALSDIDGRESEGIPRKAPILFKEHSDEDPLLFTARVYSKWLRKKNISRADIRRLDPQLYNALYNLSQPSEKMDQIGLRTKKQLNDIKLEAISNIQRPSTTLKMGELPPDQREHLRLHNLIRNRKQRSKN